MSNQSRSFNFPQRGSASCFAIKEENEGPVATREVRDDIAAGNEVTKGVYKDR